MRPFLASDAATVALEHVRVIHGSGAPLVDDQTIVIAGGRTAAIQPARTATVPSGARRIDLAGHTVIRGLVGLHEHRVDPSGGGISI